MAQCNPCNPLLVSVLLNIRFIDIQACFSLPRKFLEYELVILSYCTNLQTSTMPGNTNKFTTFQQSLGWIVHVLYQTMFPSLPTP